MDYRETEPTGLGQVLERYLREKGYTRHGAEVLAALLWAEVVGPWYARHTEVVRAERGVLTVHCDSAPLAQQLTADSDKILTRLNRRVAEHLQSASVQEPGSGEPPCFIHEIRAASAYPGRSRQRLARPERAAARLPTPAQLDAYPLTAEEEARVQTMAAAIADEELRRRFAATVRASLRLKRWQREHGWQPCPTCGNLLAPDEKRCFVCHPPEAPPQVRE